jgi:hypothetical protein
MAYSEDLKERVLSYVREGGSRNESARIFRVARCTVYAWLAQPADHQPGKPAPKTSRTIDREQLAQLMAAQPDLMIKKIAQFLPPYSRDLNPIEKLWVNLKRQREFKQCALDALILESGYLRDRL